MAAELWKVIDANALRRGSDLKDFFKADSRNVGVITDFCSMECYKGADPVRGLSASIAIIAQHSSQIVILHCTSDVVALTVRKRVHRQDLVDADQTAGFDEFCKAVQRTRAGNDSTLISLVHENAAIANDHLHQFVADAGNLAEGILALAEELPADLVTRLRRKGPLLSEDVKTVLSGIVSLSAELFNKHPELGDRPHSSKLPQTFIFRYALACYLLTIRWIAEGGVHNVKPQVLANDFVDMNYVAYATYFDGMLTGDKKLLQLFQETHLFLRTVFV